MPLLKIKRVGLIACGVLWREFSFFASKSPLVIEFFFQPQGLHNNPEAMRERLQSVVSQIEGKHNFDYLVFGYGLCSRGIEGLWSQKTPMVFARAHDCLTFLLGGRKRQGEIYQEHPDAYWFSPGWIETGTQPSKERIERSLKILTDQYGEEKAKILLPELETWLRNYHKAIYIDLGVGPRRKYLAYTKKCAQELGWQMIQLPGDPTLVKNLLFGNWDKENFLVAPPKERLKVDLKKDLICSVPDFS